MKRQIKVAALLVLSVFIIQAANGQEKSGSDIRPIEIETADEAAIIIGGIRFTLSDAIRTAIEKNHDILSGKYDVAMTDTYTKQYDTKYSPFFIAEGGFSTKENPELMQSQYGSHVTSFDVSASISKLFSSGTALTVGVQNKYANTQDSLYTPENTYTPVVFVNLEQELLQNAFGYRERREEKILKNTAQMQKDAILYQLSLVVVNVIVEYWNVIVYRTHLDNAELMLRETKKVRRIVSDNVKLGLAEQFELNLWNSLVASAEASVAQAEQEYRDSLRKFLQTVDMEGEISFQGKAILSDRLPEINAEEAIKTAYSRRVDYLNAKRSLENAQLELDMYENDALPSVVGSVTLSTMDYNENADDSYGNTAALKYPSVEARIKLTYPLDDQNQEVNERNSRWKIEQAKQDIKKYERLVKDDVTSKIEKIETTYKLYRKAREAREQAEIYYSRMVANLRRGRFTASVVREALDALVNSREGELRTLVYFNASLLEFEVSKNQLFETYKIDVEKYIPKE